MARPRRKTQPGVTIIMVGIDLPDPLDITTPAEPALTTRHDEPVKRSRWFKRRQSKLWKHLPDQER